MIFAFILAAQNASAGEPLTYAELEKIITGKHSPELKVAALKVYPKVLTFDVTVKTKPVDGEEFVGKGTATDKWVDGKYIVTEVLAGPQKIKFHMVVGYDADQEVYRKYVIFEGKVSGQQVGTRVGKTRTVSWVDVSEVKHESKLDNQVIETHTDTQTTWKSIYIKDGKVTKTEVGTAVEKKK